MSTKIMSSAQFIVFQVFWNLALTRRPPKNHFRLRVLSLGFYTFFWLTRSCKLSTLGKKFLNMSNITPVSLPSAGLYCDLTPPFVHNFVRFWMKRCVQFVTPVLLQSPCCKSLSRAFRRLSAWSFPFYFATLSLSCTSSSAATLEERLPKLGNSTASQFPRLLEAKNGVEVGAQCHYLKLENTSQFHPRRTAQKSGTRGDSCCFYHILTSSVICY